MASFFNRRNFCKSISSIVILLLSIQIYILLNEISSDDPIQCYNNTFFNCTITNSYGIFPDRSICRVAQVTFPTTEDELILTVASATKNKRKMKVATRYSHSIPKLVCPDGEDGLLISTKHLNKIHDIDTTDHTMTVDSGVTLRQLIDEAAKVGLVLPYTPYWWGLTVGGMLATGAHGSSLWGNGGTAVHDYVLELRIVSPGGPEDGFVKIRSLDKSDPDFNAAKLSLGVLGVISQVTLKLEPMFKRSITYITKNDSNLGDEALMFGRKYEFADITWYPSQGKVLYRVDHRVPLTTYGNGLYDFIAFQSMAFINLKLSRRIEEYVNSIGNTDLICLSTKLVPWVLKRWSYGLTNDGYYFKGYPVVGYHNHLQSSGTCLDETLLNKAQITTCLWDPRVNGTFYHQTTISIGMSKVKSFIKDVQKLVTLHPQSLCVLDQYNGILMRYVKASTAYLGKQEHGIDFDVTYYRSKDPLAPRMFEDVLEEIEQMAVFKYGGLPHWGKNRNLAFEGAINKYKNGGEFVKVKERFDPLRLFSSKWSDQVLGLEQGLSIVKEGCALEGLCVCSEDIHCAPSKGYFCRSGLVFKDARVCRRVPS